MLLYQNLRSDVLRKRVTISMLVAVVLSAAVLSGCETTGGRIPTGPYGGCPHGYHPGPEHRWCYPN